MNVSNDLETGLIRVPLDVKSLNKVQLQELNRIRRVALTTLTTCICILGLQASLLTWSTHSVTIMGWLNTCLVNYPIGAFSAWHSVKNTKFHDSVSLPRRVITEESVQYEGVGSNVIKEPPSTCRKTCKRVTTFVGSSWICSLTVHGLNQTMVRKYILEHSSLVVIPPFMILWPFMALVMRSALMSTFKNNLPDPEKTVYVIRLEKPPASLLRAPSSTPTGLSTPPASSISGRDSSSSNSSQFASDIRSSFTRAFPEHANFRFYPEGAPSSTESSCAKPEETS